MEIYGGTTTSSGELVYYSKHYQGIAKYNKDLDKVEIDIVEDKVEDQIFRKIPFLRGIISTFEQHFFKGNTLIINTPLIIFVALYIADIFLPSFHILDIGYILYIVISFIYAKGNKQMTELHGAEHLVANYYDEYKEIDIMNIEKIRGESMLRNDCGTVYYSFNLIIIFSLSFILHDFLLRYILTTSIVSEISRYSDKKIVQVIFYPLFKLGIIIQDRIFLLPPRDVDIRMAVELIHKLEEVEKLEESEKCY